MDLLIALGNHLWQSTMIALGIAAVPILMRRVPARTHCWLWLAALLKFVLPITVLITMGSMLAPRHWSTTDVEPPAYYSMDTISQPFTYTPAMLPNAMKTEFITPRRMDAWMEPGLGAIWVLGFAAVLASWFVSWRRMAAVRRRATVAIHGRVFDLLRRVRAHAGLGSEVVLLLSENALEPGILGIVQPALLWPRDLSARLNEAEMAAILAHEVEHVRRRDNLIAAIATAVAAIFWFHPLVWWLHKRLMDNREAACDEAVLMLGNEPEVYAASILRTCQFCVEAPAVCAAGITGSELKARVRRIVSRDFARRLPRIWRWTLAALGIAVVAGPVLFGVVDVPRVRAALLEETQDIAHVSFEVISIKPADPASAGHASLGMSMGRFTTRNESLRDIIMFAYDAKSTSQISGCPDWVVSSLFDIDAKEDEATAAALHKMPTDERVRQVKLMVQTLLAERFQLKVSREMKEIPVYALVIAKRGPKLTQSEAPFEKGVPPAAGTRRLGIGFNVSPGELRGINATLDMFASGPLSEMPETEERVVVNKTGLTGHYDFILKWTPENPSQGAAGPGDLAPPSSQSDSSAPGLFTALEEQLGLKLESQKGSVETLVIDHIQRASAN
jgi:bla regulator protein blaR1